MSYYNNLTLDDGAYSKFNEGALKTLRIHTLQATINEVNINLLIYYEEYGMYGYQVKFECLKSLFSECYPKLAEARQEQGKARIQKLKSFMTYNLAMVEYENPITHMMTARVNPMAWKVLEEELFDFYLLTKEFLDESGFGSPNEEDDEGL